LDTGLTILMMLGVPVALCLATGSPISQLHGQASLLLRAAVLSAWALWLWCAIGVLAGVVTRLRTRDLAITEGTRRLERISIALAGVIMTVSAWALPGAGGAPIPSHPATHVTASSTQTPGPAAALPADTTATYQVQVGDCLWDIAERLYGDGDLWPLLANANLGSLMSDGEVFVNPSLIMPGWELRVPAAAPISPAAPAPAVAESPAPEQLRQTGAKGHPASLSLDVRGASSTDAAVMIAPAAGVGLLLFALLRRKLRRDASRRGDESAAAVDLALAADRMRSVPLASMAEQAVWLADEDGVLDRPLLLGLASSGARLFGGSEACWTAPAGELLGQAPFVDHAPALIISLGEHRETSWSLVVPRGCDAQLSGDQADELLDLTLGLQGELAWGARVLLVDDARDLVRTALTNDEGTLIVCRSPRGPSSPDGAIHITTVEDADITITSNTTVIGSLGIEFPSNRLAIEEPSLGASRPLDADRLESAGSPDRDDRCDQEITEHRGEVVSVVDQSEVVVRLLCSEPRIEGGLSPVEPKRARRATELLAYLSLHHPQPITSDRLRSRVLGTSTADAASKTLFNVSSSIRSALGTHDGEPLFPRATRNGLYRSGPHITCDISLMKEWTEAADAADDDDAAIACYRAALDLIESEPLATVLVGYEWFDAEGHRGQLESCVERSALSLAALALDHGLAPLAEKAIAKARIVVPYSESLAEMAIEVAGAQLDTDGLHRAFRELTRVIDDLDPGRSPRPAVEERYLELQSTLADRP
jgi:hypothetical protein